MAKRLGPYGHNRIEELRLQRRLSRDALGKLIGTKGGQIQKLELGERRLTLEWMQRIAGALGVETAELLPGDPKRAAKAPPPSTDFPIVYIDGAPYAALRTAIGAADWPPLAERKVYSLAFLRSITSSPPDQLLVMRAHGDAMTPTIADQDLIVIDQGAPIGRAGLYAIRSGSEIEFRRISMNPATRRIDIRADNPAYPGLSDIDPSAIEVVGRVLLVSHLTV